MYSKLLDIVVKSPTETPLGRAKPPQKNISVIQVIQILIRLTHSTSQSLFEGFLHGTRFSTHGNNCANSFGSQIAVFTTKTLFHSESPCKCVSTQNVS